MLYIHSCAVIESIGMGETVTTTNCIVHTHKRSLRHKKCKRNETIGCVGPAANEHPL